MAGEIVIDGRKARLSSSLLEAAHRHRQRHDPANERPAEKQVENKNRRRVRMTPPEGNKRRREIDEEREQQHDEIRACHFSHSIRGI